MIELIVKNKNFENIALIDSYISLICTTSYNEGGEFELCVAVSEKNIKFLKMNYYITRNDNNDTFIIENLQITINDDKEELMIISGRTIDSIISRRIIENQTILKTTVFEGIKKLLDENLINPKNNDRKIPNFTIKNVNFTDKISRQFTGDNLLEAIIDICQSYNLGFKLNLKENIFELELYKGVNRSYSQNEVPYIVFSDEYDNLLSSNYAESTKELVTNVLVAGEGEGDSRRKLWVSELEKTGLERYEFFKDSRNTSSNDGEVSEEDYKKQLQQEGLEYLTKKTIAFSGEVYFDYVGYGKNVFLGDIVTIQNKHWNLYINARLNKIIESIDEGGKHSIEPIFTILNT